MSWGNIREISPKTYTCGYCDKIVGSRTGYLGDKYEGCCIHLCPFCDRPTYFEYAEQTPGVSYGNEVAYVPEDVTALYNETRQCMSVTSYTAAVLCCRKLLMNIAVAQGASEGERFITYVNYLADNSYVPPNSRGWVDHIRQRGNEANHEISLVSQEDAEKLITFVEMLLKIIYEFPGKLASDA